MRRVFLAMLFVAAMTFINGCRQMGGVCDCAPCHGHCQPFVGVSEYYPTENPPRERQPEPTPPPKSLPSVAPHQLPRGL